MNLFYPRKMIRRLPGLVIKDVPLPNPELIQGFGKRSSVGDICRKRGFHSVLLVTDKTIFGLKFHESIVQSLEKEGIACRVFCNIASEPDENIVREGREAARECNADCVVALGGGSVMDSSKIIAASSTYYMQPLGYYLQKFVFAKTLPMITIPSTAGTGAEITVGAIVKNNNGVKKSSVIVGLQITDVILDSELTVNAPEKVTVNCAIDALSHGLEGCLADVKVNRGDMEKSLLCVKLVMENLPELIKKPQDTDRRQKMALAANYGGNAINKQLAGYVHAFAHTIGGFYHISHGEAIAYCLFPIISCQRKICAEKLYELSCYCGYAQKGDDMGTAINRFLHELRELLISCGFGNGLTCLNRRDYTKLIEEIDSDSINYSPSMTFTDKEIVLLLNRIRKPL